MLNEDLKKLQERPKTTRFNAQPSRAANTSDEIADSEIEEEKDVDNEINLGMLEKFIHKRLKIKLLCWLKVWESI